MKTLSSPTLLPVVELPPYRFLNHLPVPDPYPRGKAWKKYWCDSLAASGFAPVDPVFEGSNLVSVEQLDATSSLDAIVEYEVSKGKGEDWLPLCLYGGYVLYDSDELVVEPQCCGRLMDLVDWRAAATEKKLPRGFWIGIGHPGLGVEVVSPGLLRFWSDGPEDEQHPRSFVGKTR